MRDPCENWTAQYLYFDADMVNIIYLYKTKQYIPTWVQIKLRKSENDQWMLSMLASLVTLEFYKMLPLRETARGNMASLCIIIM